MRWSRRWGSSTSRWRPREPEEAARRSDAGGADSDAARRRVAATLDAARRVELGRLVVGVPGPETEAARRWALAAARTVGRSGLVDEARGAAVALRAPWEALAGSAAIPDPGSIASFASSLAELPGRRGGRAGLIAAVIVALFGLLQLAAAQAIGLAFLAVAAVMLRNTLARRSS